MALKDPADMNKDEMATELHGHNPAVSVDAYKRMTEDTLRLQVVYMRSLFSGGVTPPPGTPPTPPVATPGPPVVTPPATPDPVPVVYVEVPRLLRLTIEQAREKILDADLLFDPTKVKRQNDPFAKRVEVIYQRPTAGDMVPQGTTMELTVSVPEAPPKPPKTRRRETSWAKALVFPSDLRKKIDEMKD